ncbi:MAG: hypothetical protein V3U34_07150 [candidate division NC10 bacterium]|jgi:hypothetical protein
MRLPVAARDLRPTVDPLDHRAVRHLSPCILQIENKPCLADEPTRPGLNLEGILLDAPTPQLEQRMIRAQILFCHAVEVTQSREELARKNRMLSRKE